MMLESTMDRTELQPFDMRVEKQSNGSYRAWVPNVKGVDPVVEMSREIAVTKLNGQLQDAHRQGRLQR